MQRRLIVLVSVLAGSLVIPVPEMVRAAGTTPAAGDWNFCVSSSEVGCIESVGFVDGSSNPVTVTSRTALSAAAGPTVSFGCSSFSTNQSECDADAQTPNSPRSVGKCGFTEPARLMGNVTWSGHEGEPFEVRVRTGDFDPVFSWGNGITGTTRIVNGDGTFGFVWKGFIDEIITANIPSSLTNPPLPANHYQLMKEFFATAVADSSLPVSKIYVMPAAYFHITTPIEKVDGKWVQSCADIPMVGMWVEANAQMFSYGFGFNGRSALASTKFSFEASSPHFLVGGAQVNSARFKMFIPDSYVESLGHTSDTFDVQSLRITTADSQGTSPTLTRVTGGFGLDFGIEHYSSPNPTVEIHNRNWSDPVGRTTAPAATPGSGSTGTSPVKTTPTKSLRAGKSLAAATLLKSVKISRPAGATTTLRVVSGSRYCRVSGTTVKALKTGTCKVSITVRQRGKSTKSGTLVVKVTR